MKGCRSHRLHPPKRAWETYVAAALGLAVVVLVAALLTVLCQTAACSAMAAGNSSAELAQLEEVLVITNQSLAETRRQWEGCKEQLGVLEGKASELEQALANVTQLQKETRALRAEVAQQQEQLRDMQSSRDKLQLQNQLLEKQLQDMRSQHSGGNRFLAMSLSLLALLLPMMLLL
ncbi:uncharacterized protein J5M81_014385 [Pluvialis apricaria]